MHFVQDTLYATRDHSNRAARCAGDKIILYTLLLALPAMSAGVARSGRQLTVTVYSDFA